MALKQWLLERWPKLLGAIFLALGLLGIFPDAIPYPPINGIEELHHSIVPELIGIGLTVLIIDSANEQRMQAQEQRTLILQLGSPPPNNALALQAARALRERGWLAKGILRKADLENASLDDADLHGADLRGVNLRGADLNRADLSECDLRESDLSLAELRDAELIGANLTGTILQEADLSGADLTDAIISDEQLQQAGSLKGATMPDGKKYKNDPQVK